MSRKPVVVQGPPKDQPRSPVLIREGPPPRPKRNVVDITTGVIGALLLILAVALFGILPDEPVPARTFDVTYTEDTVEDGEVRNGVFGDQQSQRFAFPIESSYVYTIQFTIEFQDDVASSLPDTFAFQILNPNSDPVTDEVRFTSPEPVSDGNPVAPTYTAGVIRQLVTAEIAIPPESGPQAPASDEEDLANARARIQDEAQTAPAGDWILDVYLANTGDCPDTASDPARALACQTETEQQGDVGNSMQIVKVTFTTYEPTAIE